ncbi:uncharacterized protein LOC135493533 [Lineus longissimus]|uniref:uncharacterized protein LOC135493533 n=1 Tax=Lineus longissimus TaxID=88925 RepID=UPI00315D2E1A
MYRKGGSTPRLSMEIAEATPQSQNRIIAPVSWTRNRDWGGVIYVDYYHAVRDFSFIHLQATHIPDGCAVTGMAFHKYNNRLGIMLQYRKIDFNTGLMSGPRKWQLPQGWGQTEGTHYIGDQQWTPNAEIGDVLPNPKAWVTGASLYKKTDKTMALKLRILYE